MIMKSIKIQNFIFLCIFVFSLWRGSLSEIPQRCPENLVGSGKRIFLIYKQRGDLRSANKICSRFQGNLAEVIDSSLQRRLINKAVSLLLPQDLRLISVFRNRNNRFRLLYTTDTIANSRQWRRPSQGDLTSFRLYSRATEKFNRKVSFCNQQHRYAVINRCYRNFNLNFTLFGAATSIPNTITIHNYDYFQNELFSTFISLNKNLRIRNKNQEQLRKNTNATIFIPEISVFIGAQSDVGQSNWFWNNRKMINNQMFSRSNPSICQQMTWPLTYDDGINLRPTECSDKANFICQVYFAIEAELIQTCDGAILRVFWNQTDFYKDFVSENDFIVQVDIFDYEISQTVSFNQYDVTFPVERFETLDKMQATLKIRYCPSFQVTTTASVIMKPKYYNKTLYNKSFTNCILEWVYNQNHSDISNYQIEVKIENETVLEVVNVSSKYFSTIPLLIRHELNLTGYLHYSINSVNITTVWCDGTTTINTVNGSCFLNAQEPSEPKGLVIFAIVLVAAFMILGFASLLASKRVKANKIKDYVAKETRRINIAYLEIDSNPSSPRFRSHTYEDIDDYIDMSAVYEGGSISSYYEHMENVYEQPIPIVK